MNLARDTISKFSLPLMEYHISGGLRCLTDNTGLCLLQTPWPSYELIWSDVNKNKPPAMLGCIAGIRVLARTNYKSQKHLDDPYPADFILRSPNDGNYCLCSNQILRWNGLSHAYRNNDNGEASFQARRIQQQIVLCRDHLHSLSVAYKHALLERLDGSTTRSLYPAHLGFTSDRFSIAIGSRVQAFLNELYALRDAVFEFAFTRIYEKTSPYSLKSLRSAAAEFDDDLSKQIVETTRKDTALGKVALISLYRDTFMHYTSALGLASGSIYKIRIIPSDVAELPCIVFPLYDNIEVIRAIERREISGHSLRANHIEIERFKTQQNHTDALEFCFDAFCHVLEICDLSRKAIPIPDYVPSFADANVKYTTINRDGSIRLVLEYSSRKKSGVS